MPPCQCAGAGARRASDGQPTVAKTPRRIDHDAPELHDCDVARAEPLARAIGDRAHGLPHRDVLVRDAVDAGVAAALHRLAILEVIVFARPDSSEIGVEVDANLSTAELAPRFLLDALLVAPGDKVEHRVRVVLRDIEDRQVVEIVRRDEHGEGRHEERDA
jgi:hypothetical protein